MCAGCPHRGLFYTLNKNKCTVLGDIGCYTLGAVAPLSAMDMTLCMGASISAIHGFNKALGTESEGRTVAVIGDSTFMHSGMTGLANIAYNPVSYTHLDVYKRQVGQCLHRGNLKHLAEEGKITENSVYCTVGELAAGMKQVGDVADQKLLVVPIGMGCLDVAVAGIAYRKAFSLGVGETFAFDE